ncbi:hypothetical protein [Flavobacterium rhizosphaerae]|uniref:Uncharacterized protein n=1 Tax=Flavobacterium rhizosphaerae TaxID=3163298 RepID=A0ABW8YWX5_9FLAO
MEHIIKIPEDKGAINIFSLKNTIAENETEKSNIADSACSLLLKNLVKTNLRLLKLNDLRSIVLL